MRKINYERLAQYDATALRETEDTMLERIRREVEAKKAEEIKQAKKKKRKKKQSRDRD
jgi:hypothetical protein